LWKVVLEKAKDGFLFVGWSVELKLLLMLKNSRVDGGSGRLI
jgi:hypothetical protein